MARGKKRSESDGVVWEVDRRRTSMVIGKGSKAYTPDIVLWADADSGLILATDILEPGASDEVAVESFNRALAAPMMSTVPVTPDVVRARRPELAEAVRPVAERSGIRVEVAESLPAMDEVFEAMDAQLGSPANQGYLEKTSIPEPIYADFFAAAAEYYRLKPWKVLTDEETVLLLCDAWDPPHRYAVIMGAGGETYGFVLYHSWNDLQRLRRGAETLALKLPSLALVYEKLSGLGPVRIEEMKEHGWEVATRNAYPLAMRVDPKSTSVWPREADVRVLTAATRLLGPFVKSLTKARWLPEGQDWIEETHRVSVAGEEIEVTASFPAPRTPKRRLPRR